MASIQEIAYFCPNDGHINFFPLAWMDGLCCLVGVLAEYALRLAFCQKGRARLFAIDAQSISTSFPPLAGWVFETSFWVHLQG